MAPSLFHTPPLFSVPPYTEQIGAHILNYAAKRVDFYRSILMLMQSFGLPPPPITNSTTTLNASNPGTASSSEQDVSAGMRVKRSRSDAASGSAILGDSDEMDQLGRVKQRKLAEGAVVEEEEEEEEDARVNEPAQPLHLVPHSSGPRLSVRVKSVDMDVALDEEGRVKVRPNGGGKSERVEVVPFALNSVIDPSQSGDLSLKFISEDALKSNRMSLERTCHPVTSDAPDLGSL